MPDETPPITVFEGKRVDVGFFRIGPRQEQTIREKYRTQAFLGLDHGEKWFAPGPKLKLLIGKATGLHRLVWDGERNESLDTLSWETREHLLGAVAALQAELNQADREDALDLIGRHEGHHLHCHGIHLTCSCDDKVMLTYWSGIPPRHPEELHCDVCDKQGLVSYRQAFGHERGEKP